MTEPPAPETPDNQTLVEQLTRMNGELRALGEQLGAVPPGEPPVYSLRRARITLMVSAVLATLVGWILWSHWHVLWLFLAPLAWIFVSGWRHQRRLRSRGRRDRA
jgi:hypothetical protein